MGRRICRVRNKTSLNYFKSKDLQWRMHVIIQIKIIKSTFISKSNPFRYVLNLYFSRFLVKSHSVTTAMAVTSKESFFRSVGASFVLHTYPAYIHILFIQKNVQESNIVCGNMDFRMVCKELKPFYLELVYANCAHYF